MKHLLDILSKKDKPIFQLADAFLSWYSAPASDFADAAQTVRQRGNLVDFVIFGSNYGLQFSLLVSDQARHKTKNLINYYMN